MDDGSRQNPAYRATLLQIRRGGTNSRLVSLFLLESFLTKLISNLPKKTGNRIGQRAEKRATQSVYRVKFKVSLNNK
jgi:hypothetical protein